jgi:hypothetical protein
MNQLFGITGSGAEYIKSSGDSVEGYEVINRLIVEIDSDREVVLPSAFLLLFDPAQLSITDNMYACMRNQFPRYFVYSGEYSHLGVFGLQKSCVVA